MSTRPLSSYVVDQSTDYQRHFSLHARSTFLIDVTYRLQGGALRDRSMPMGTLHTIKGIIRPGKRWYVIAVHGGGEWELEIDGKVARYVDCDVVLEGVRTGFNRLEVVRIKLEGDDWPPERRRA